MLHPLVSQLRFARREFIRCLEGVSAAEAMIRPPSMNCLSWIVAHLAIHEHYLWLIKAQERNIAPNLKDIAGFGRPPTTPALDEMWRIWQEITSQGDLFLEALNDSSIDDPLVARRDGTFETVGKSLLRITYHYWFHLGEAYAIRQILGHKDLPEFVGDLADVAY